METETQSAAVVSKLIEFLVFVGQDEFQVERGLELSSVILQLEPENALVKKYNSLLTSMLREGIHVFRGGIGRLNGNDEESKYEEEKEDEGEGEDEEASTSDEESKSSSENGSGEDASTETESEDSSPS